LGLSEEE